MRNHFTYSVFLFLCLNVFAAYTGNAQRVGPVKVTEANARAYRDSVKLKIFGSINFPYNWMPDAVLTNVNSLANYNGFPYNAILYPQGNLSTVDQLNIFPSSNSADFPVPVHAFVFHPHSSNGKLFIYHSGHCATIAPTEDIWVNANQTEPGLVIPRLIAEGYTVLAVPMINYRTTPPNNYYCGYNNHNALFNEGHYANPLSLFFKPLIASLNYLGRSNYQSIYMCGLSGGGWVTSIYPAIDTSIIYSFPIAGAWPKAVRSLFYPNGDKEQTWAPLYNLLDAHELFALSCLAPARRVLQINNRYDNCCFGGNQGHLYYVDSVKKALQGTEGVFDFYLDETIPNHQVAPRSVTIMLQFLESGSTHLIQPPPDTVTALIPFSYDLASNFPLSGGSASDLRFSLIKAPSWISIDTLSGILNGTPPEVPITGRKDTINFKIEDPAGRFVLYNYILTEKKSAPILFTIGQDLQTVYMIPPFSHSVDTANIQANQYFETGTSVLIDSISVYNKSLLVLHLNQPLVYPRVIKYSGQNQANGIRYKNGLMMDNFPYIRVLVNEVKSNLATKGMLRFNTDTGKFEYFNGISWINLN